MTPAEGTMEGGLFSFGVRRAEIPVAQDKVVQSRVDLWQQRGEKALMQVEAQMERGLHGMVELAVKKAQIPDDVKTLVNAFRVVAAEDEKRFELWTQNLGLDKDETRVLKQVVEAMGVVEDLPGALRNLLGAERGKFIAISGGSLLEKVALHLSGADQTRSERGARGKWGMGGSGASSASGEPKLPVDEESEDGEDDEHKDVVKGFWARRKRGGEDEGKGPALVRQPGRGRATVILAAASLCLVCSICAVVSPEWGRTVTGGWGEGRKRLDDLVLRARSLVDEEARKDLFEKDLSEKYGVRRGFVQDAEIDINKIVQGGDEDHDQIGYVVGLFDKQGVILGKKQIAYGETTMLILSKEGFLSPVGEGYVMDANQEVNLRTRLTQNGYDGGDVENFISWVEWYVKNRKSMLSVTTGKAEDVNRELAVLRGESSRKLWGKRERDKLDSARAIQQSMMRRRLPRL